MAASLLLVHGAGIKPPPADYEQLWIAALRRGVERDHPDLLGAFDAATIDFLYYGDLNAQIRQTPIDMTLDLADRRIAFDALNQLTRTRSFRRTYYERLPGKSSVREFFADLGAPLSGLLGMGRWLKGRVLPELGAYWNNTDGYRDTLDARIDAALARLLGNESATLILSHCTGSVAVYNGLWRSSHDAAKHLPGKVGLWVTFGSPLADDTVRRSLQGRSESGPTRYPTNLLRWHNVAAEDDYVCHDETVANDFAPMLAQRQISQIVDYQIYNLSVRYGRSDPHASVGYLIHPRIAELVADWLRESAAAT